MATNHGQNNQVQLKYIQKKGLKSIFTVHFVAAIMMDNIPDHFTTSIGVNCSRVAFIDSNDRFLKYFRTGLLESVLVSPEIEHLREDEPAT
ncbi:flagellar motor switch protein FliM [Sesbania bispinosa]|nr:flagellar motor switch protein FliM [Sesbania bispinosa]